jgi:hypothetical protein
MENKEEILKSVLRVLLAHQRELDSLNRVVAAILSTIEPAQAGRVNNEIALLVRSARPVRDADPDIRHIVEMLG